MLLYKNMNKQTTKVIFLDGGVALLGIWGGGCSGLRKTFPHECVVVLNIFFKLTIKHSPYNISIILFFNWLKKIKIIDFPPITII